MGDTNTRLDNTVCDCFAPLGLRSCLGTLPGALPQADVSMPRWGEIAGLKVSTGAWHLGSRVFRPTLAFSAQRAIHITARGNAPGLGFQSELEP